MSYTRKNWNSLIVLKEIDNNWSMVEVWISTVNWYKLYDYI